MIKVYLRHDLPTATMSLYIIDEYEDGRRYMAKPVELVFEEMSEIYVGDPTLRFAHMQGTQFLTELASQLAENGFQVSNEVEKGELKATKKHLEDMRSLVKGLKY